MSFPTETVELGFTPSVSWQLDDLTFATGISATGEANVSSRLNIGYYFENNSDQAKEFDFYLLLRPYQVNPYYQFLNLEGGAGKIASIKEVEPGRRIAVDEKMVISLRDYDLFTANTFDIGNPIDLLRKELLSQNSIANDPSGLANGVIKYSIKLQPRETTKFFVLVPFYEDLAVDNDITNEHIAKEFDQTNEFWRNKIDHIKFNLPESANRIVNTYKSNLFYILVNRDKAGIQPGSRSYERSWIRDGSLTSSALDRKSVV